MGGQANESLVDPDANHQELLIEWDIWRNKVASQVERNLTKHLQGWGGYEINRITNRVEAKFPSGIHTGIDFVIGSDQTVLKTKVINPSGYKDYDALVEKSVYELTKKSSLLRFPEHSRRQSVEQALEYQTSKGTHQKHFIKFGDTEIVHLGN